MITSPRLVRGAVRLMRVLPEPVARGIATVAGTAFYLLHGPRRRVVLDNVAHLLPQAPPHERRRLARRTFVHIAQAAVDMFRLPSMRREDLLALFTSTTLGHVDEALALGRGVIIATAHLGAYELGGAWFAALGYPTHAMVEDLSPDVLEALAIYRTATGMQLISMKQGIREVHRLLAAGAIVLLVADRAIGPARGAVRVPFANGVRPVPTGPATFAMLTGAPVVVGTITLNQGGGARYLAHFEPPLVAEGRGDDERLRLTRLITDRLADAVQAHPDEWFVFQPQWIPRDGD